MKEERDSQAACSAKREVTCAANYAKWHYTCDAERATLNELDEGGNSGRPDVSQTGVTALTIE